MKRMLVCCLVASTLIFGGCTQNGGQETEPMASESSASEERSEDESAVNEESSTSGASPSNAGSSASEENRTSESTSSGAESGSEVSDSPTLPEIETVSEKDFTSAITVPTQPLEGLGWVSFRIENHSTMEATSSNYYAVEQYDGSSWREVPLRFDVEDAELLLPPGEALEISIGLYPDQYEYTAGSYRVVATVWVGETAFPLTAELLIIDGD